jgi:hypothetical protein
MSDRTDQIYYNGYNINIYYDEDCESPSEWGDEGLFLIANHRDFYVKPPKCPSRRSSMNDDRPYFESAFDDYKDTHHIFGLEAYIHSGISLSISYEGNFPDRRWDVSQLGYVFVSKEEWPEREKAKEIARGYIETWNDYLSGSVYYYKIENSEEEEEDDLGCGGWYGYDHETSGLLSEAKAEIDFLIEERIKEAICDTQEQLQINKSVQPIEVY